MDPRRSQTIKFSIQNLGQIIPITEILSLKGQSCRIHSKESDMECAGTSFTWGNREGLVLSLDGTLAAVGGSLSPGWFESRAIQSTVRQSE